MKLVGLMEEKEMKVHYGDFTPKDVDRIREETVLGSVISFKTKRRKGFNHDEGAYVEKRVVGTVTAKYPQIFLIRDCQGNEETYTWVDYLLGKYDALI